MPIELLFIVLSAYSTCFVQFLPARRYASAGNRDRNVSVRPSVRLARAGIVSKRRKRHDFFTIW